VLDGPRSPAMTRLRESPASETSTRRSSSRPPGGRTPKGISQGCVLEQSCTPAPQQRMAAPKVGRRLAPAMEYEDASNSAVAVGGAAPHWCNLDGVSHRRKTAHLRPGQQRAPGGLFGCYFS